MSDTCHELLLRLAGRLPDDLLWRYRDWAASDAYAVLARSLPRTLLHGRIPLTDHELRLLQDALVPYGAEPGAVSSVKGLDELPPTDYTFSPESPDRVPMGDSATVVLGATLRGRRRGRGSSLLLAHRSLRDQPRPAGGGHHRPRPADR